MKDEETKKEANERGKGEEKHAKETIGEVSPLEESSEECRE